MAALSGDSSPMCSTETMADVGNNITNINNPATSNRDNSTTTTITTATTTNQNGDDVVVDRLPSALNQTTNSTNAKQTISAPADSSDNQPATPQPKIMNADNSESHQEQLIQAHNPYDNNAQVYATSSSNGGAPIIGHHLYSTNLYSAPNMQIDLNSTNSTTAQSQQQQQQQGNYATFLNNYEFYQQQQQMQQQQQQQGHLSTQAVGLAHSASDVQSPSVDYLNASSSASPYAPAHSDYIQKHQQNSSGVRYHPYLQTPISAISSLSSNSNSSNNTHALMDAATSTPSLMSPRVASSTSPSSTSNPNMLISGSGSSIGSLSAGNPNSPANTTSAVALQCKKCGFLCASEVELQEHSANSHGTSPYASSGYASSPYIKEEHSQQQQQQPQVPVSGGHPATVRSASTQPGGGVANNSSHTGEILDLDNQKLYPPTVGSMPVMQTSHHFVDPLQSMHSMQQRAGITGQWEAARNNEGLTTYLPSSQSGIEDTKPLSLNSGYYATTKQSEYAELDNTNIKSEYPLIKTEYTPNEMPRYLNDKPQFNVTATAGESSQQQHMLPPAVSSSPAEFPSTTTGGTQDIQQQQQQQLASQTKTQQYRAGSFEPSSSSTSPAIGANNVVSGTKASNWKSNEARRPKTYNCTACNKWFTSSGHLKRHYNTTLHKNAVKASDKPDPATLPISAHHHPTRDPTTKTTRKTANSTSLPTSSTGMQQPQHPPAPVHPPEPPNSPTDYGGGGSMRTGTSSLAQQQHCGVVPPHQPMDDYHQSLAYQHGNYMQTVQATTNALSLQTPAASLTGSASVTTSQQLCQQNSNILNGHPNALAGLSVPTSQIITLPMPSSQMRGLLKSSTTPTTIKIESIQTEAAMGEQQLLTAMEDPPSIQQQQQQAAYTTMDDAVLAVKQEDQLAEEQQPQVVVYQLEVETPAEDHSLLPHHQVLLPMPCPRRSPPTLLEGSQQHHFDQAAEAVEHQYHITTNNSTPEPSPLTISPQQYQEHQLQQMEMQDNIYSHTATMLQPQPQQLQPNIMEEPDYSIMHLDINTQLNNTLQQQQLATTIPTMPTITRTINMDSTPVNPHIHHHHHHHTMQLVPMEPQSPVSMGQQQQLDTIQPNTSTQVLPSHIIHSNNIIPSYQHLQQPASVQLQALEHTLTYHPTIIGNNTHNITSLPSHSSAAEIFTIDAYGNLLPQSQHQQLQQQFITTPDGQILQILPNTSVSAATLYSQASDDDSYTGQTSPAAGDLPPGGCQLAPQERTKIMKISSPLTSNNSNHREEVSSNNIDGGELVEVKPKLTEDSSIVITTKDTTTTSVTSTVTSNAAAPKTSKAINNKRNTVTASKGKAKKRNTTVVLAAGSRLLSNGRIKCESCEKDFSRGCYFTQHSKSFHSGEYPFRCEKCGKRYQSEDVYTLHLTRHRSVDKPHKCELCPKQFHHKTDLRRHIESIHTGNKQHICNICEKSFCRKDHLRKHIETHSKPKVCFKRAPRKRAKTADVSIPSAIPSVGLTSQASQAPSAVITTSVPSGSILPHFNSPPNHLFQQTDHSIDFKNNILLIDENGDQLQEDYVFVTIDTTTPNSNKFS